jgi:hypothetical protein
MNKLLFLALLLLLNQVKSPIDFCPEDQTLCFTIDHTPKCCHLKDGVCCANGRSCCRHGFLCDPVTNKCIKSSTPFNTFLDELSEVSEDPTLFSTDKISFENIVSCFSDLKTVLGDLQEVIKDWTKGDFESLIKLRLALFQLALDGYKLSKDCQLLMLNE